MNTNNMATRAHKRMATPCQAAEQQMASANIPGTNNLPKLPMRPDASGSSEDLTNGGDVIRSYTMRDVLNGRGQGVQRHAMPNLPPIVSAPGVSSAHMAAAYDQFDGMVPVQQQQQHQQATTHQNMPPPPILSRPAVPSSGSGRRRIVAINLIRESRGTVSKESQEKRYTAFVENVLMKHPQFEGVDIELYPTNFICSQVNRDKLTSADGFLQLVKALEDGLPDLDTPIDDNTTIYIIAVNLLRFGKTKEQIEYATSILKKANNKINVEIMPLDFFGYPLSDSAACLGRFNITGEEIHRDVATPVNQGKNVSSESATADEQVYVENKAKEFKKMFDANDEWLTKSISKGLSLVKLVSEKPNTDEELV